MSIDSASIYTQGVSNGTRLFPSFCSHVDLTLTVSRVEEWHAPSSFLFLLLSRRLYVAPSRYTLPTDTMRVKCASCGRRTLRRRQFFTIKTRPLPLRGQMYRAKVGNSLKATRQASSTSTESISRYSRGRGYVFRTFSQNLIPGKSYTYRAESSGNVSDEYAFTAMRNDSVMNRISS